MRIIDMIQHGNYNQISLIVDREPAFKFEHFRDPASTKQWIIAEDSGFYKFYFFEEPTDRWKAFGGRIFDIPMKSGDVLQARGQWWDGVPPQYTDTVVSVGYATCESLKRCYIFMHVYISKELIESCMANINVKHDYNCYRTFSR